MLPYNSGMSIGHEGPQRLSRRKWAKRAALTVATSPVLAQVSQKIPPQGTPVPPIAPATPEQRMQKAYADIHAVSDELSKLEVPMNIEPAFAFRP